MASADKSRGGASGDVAAGEKDHPSTSAKRSKKKLLLMIAAAVLLLCGAGGAAWRFIGARSAGHEATAEPITAEELVDVAEMTVNLRASDGGAKTLRVHLMLVPGDKTKDAITASLPLVIDAFQPFLRELRPEDIAGSAATFRIKEEMLIRANAVLGSGSVRDVLIQDLVQQ